LKNDPEASAVGYEPRRPTLLATGFFALWVAVLSLPMLTGKWLASPYSDQYATGYAFRAWGAEWWKRLGHVPLWEPELFGGMPFVGASHGDIFYPTSFLRLLLPVATVVDLNFVIHFVAAGLFTYLLLRRFHVSWAGAVTGGLAYELTGLMASYPSPGHDGKLFASTALPLALLALVLALRERRWEGYGLLAAAVALALLGHFQMAYYVLIAAGLFALYLTFDPETPGELRARVGRLALALAAVVLGYGLAMIQVLPFIQYIPFSPRAQGYHGFEGATSYAVPWAHVPSFFLRDFVGARDGYWGPNPIKLHSEYLGLPVLALAVLGAGSLARRRFILWLGGIGLLGLLISLGAGTPFYRVWWTVMPLVSKTRAPGMAFFIPAFATACFAGIGVERLERREGARHLIPWFVAAGVVIILAATGALGTVAVNLAGGAEGLGRAAVARADSGAIALGALTSGVALLLVAFIARQQLSLPRAGPALLVLLLLVVSGDLWLDARPFWVYSPLPAQTIFRTDGVIDRLRQTPLPYRTVDLGVYPGNGVTLMAFDVPQLLGTPFNEIRYFDELWNRDESFSNLRYVGMWDLYAVRYAIVPSGQPQLDSILHGFKRVLTGVPTAGGPTADLLERTEPADWARVVPAAVRVDPSQIIPTLLNPRMDYGRLVLLAPDVPLSPPPISAMPEPSRSKATVTAWSPGRMSVALDPAPDSASYLVVAENWYPDWHATVDGATATVVRGDWAVIAVPIPAGARKVELWFQSPGYALGRGISVASVGVTLALILLPGAIRRRKRG